MLEASCVRMLEPLSRAMYFLVMGNLLENVLTDFLAVWFCGSGALGGVYRLAGQVALDTVRGQLTGYLRHLLFEPTVTRRASCWRRPALVRRRSNKEFGPHARFGAAVTPRPVSRNRGVHLGADAPEISARGERTGWSIAARSKNSLYFIIFMSNVGTTLVGYAC